MSSSRGDASDSLEQYIRRIEPREPKLFCDMKYLARYMVKYGCDVESAKRWSMAGIAEFGVDLARVSELAAKYDITWKEGCEKYQVDSATGDKYLHHVAIQFPKQFIDIAASNPPGTFDEFRFWFCANNGQYWLKYSKKYLHKTIDSVFPKLMEHKHSSDRLLSEILYIILTPRESKLINLCAITATISNNVGEISLDLLKENLKWVRKSVEDNKWGKANKEFKQQLRTRYNIMKAEQDLEPINLEPFAVLWNMTLPDRSEHKEN